MINNNNNRPNNNNQLDQPIITRITSPPPPIQKTALFACFRFLIFHPFFQGAQLTHVPLCADAHERRFTSFVRGPTLIAFYYNIL